MLARLVLLFTLILACAPRAQACPSDFDEFGEDGRGVQPDSTVARGQAVAVGPGGVVYVGGNSNDSPAVLRYSAGGFLDQSFGEGGVARLERGGTFTTIVVQDDGSILAAGVVPVSSDESSALVLARFDETGELDETFGEGGYTLTFQVFQVQPRKMIIRSDGVIVVAGQSRPERGPGVGPLEPYVWFYDADGELTSKLKLGNFESAISLSVVEVADRAIMVTGVIQNISTAREAFLAKLTEEGSLDSTFSRNGIRRYGNREVTDEYKDIDVDGQGRIYVAGTAFPYARPNRSRVFVKRFLANGDRDLSYGVGGTRNFRFQEYATTFDLAVADDGKATVVADFHSSFLPVLVRATPDGKRDRTFGDYGVRELITEGSISLVSIALTPGEKIVAAGWYFEDPLVMRFEGGDWDGKEACVIRCGDADLDRGEECDDGNVTNGDGCSAGCTNE